MLDEFHLSFLLCKINHAELIAALFAVNEFSSVDSLKNRRHEHALNP